MSPSTPSPVKRRVGRPRKRLETAADGEPREQILAAASALFAARGIGEVSMLEIARESGLGQSSLYYWYRRKEQIVAELLQQVNRLPLAFARQLSAEGDGADVQLYRLVRFDVRTICDFPLEITEVHRFSRRDKPAFETYWRERRELTATLEALVRRGIEAGAFREVEPRLCALTIIAQDESVQNWYLREPRDKQPPGFRAEEIADHVAAQTLGGLMVAPSRLALLVRRAARSDP